MSSIGLIFPDQLSLNNEVLEVIEGDDQILLYEPLETFYEISHHKHKLVFLISAFRHFKKLLKHDNLIHIKIEKERSLSLINYLDSLHKKSHFNNLYVAKPSDFKTLKDLMYFCQSHEINLKVFDDKKFISTIEDYDAWSEGKRQQFKSITIGGYERNLISLWMMMGNLLERSGILIKKIEKASLNSKLKFLKEIKSKLTL